MEKEGLHFAREDEHVRRWRYCAASHACDGEKRERVSHSQQILAPTFQLLGNLQICSGHLGSGRLGKGGSMQEVCRRMGRRAGEGCRDLGFCQIASWSTRSHSLHSLCTCICIFFIKASAEGWALCQGISCRTCLTCPGFLTPVLSPSQMCQQCQPAE